MRHQKVLGALLCFALGSWHNVFASEQQTKEKMGSSAPAKPMRVSIRHIEPNGIGYDQGYTSIDGFFAHDWNQWVSFLDARAHIFNNGNPALNAGLGSRWKTDSRIWGGNLYYDYRKTTRYHYNQIGIGLESLGCLWDFRLNGYAPLGKRTSSSYDTKFAYFQGNHAFLQSKYEYVLGGANAEAALHVEPTENLSLYFATGPYYLTGRGASTWGGQARASFWMYDYLKLEGNVSYDHLFKWIGQGAISLTFSFGKERQNQQGCSNLAKRSYQQVDRFEIIPVEKTHKHFAAINPATKTPYFFTFVDNTSSSLGTYESPFASLTAAEDHSSPYGVIYVLPGDGTSTGMDTGITLKNHQALWGSSIDQMLVTNVGNIVIPSQSQGALSALNGLGQMTNLPALPIITNSSGNVVTATNGNTISGIFVDTTNATGISADSMKNLTVANCTISGSETAISASELRGNLIVSNCAIGSSSEYGIYLTNSITDLNAQIVNNDIETSGGTGFYWTLSNDSAGTFILSQNTINTPNNYGVRIVQTDTSTLAATFQENQLYAYEEYPIDFALNGAMTTCTFQNNMMTSYYGIHIVQSAGTADIAFSGNTLNASYEPLFLEVEDTGFCTVTMNNNSIYSADNYCLYLVQEGDGLVFTGTGNTISNALGGSVYFTTTTGTLDVTLIQNTCAAIENSSGTVVFEIAGGTKTTTLLQDNILIANYQPPIYYNITGGTNIDNQIINNKLHCPNESTIALSAAVDNTLLIAGNDQQLSDGYSLYATGGTCLWTINSNQFLATPPGNAAVAVTASSPAIVNVLLDSNVAYPTPGAYLFTPNTGTIHLTEENNIGQIVGP